MHGMGHGGVGGGFSVRSVRHGHRPDGCREGDVIDRRDQGVSGRGRMIERHALTGRVHDAQSEGPRRGKGSAPTGWSNQAGSGEERARDMGELGLMGRKAKQRGVAGCFGFFFF